MSILLVEDSPSLLFRLSMLLNQFGYQVITAEDGQQAWEILQQRDDIHLVLTDWKMPHMDGLQLCQAIRQAPSSHYIYIILLTSKDDKTDVVAGMEAGADDYLTKPVNNNELRVRLNAGQRILKLEQTLAEHNNKLQSAYKQISQDLQFAAKMQQALLPPSGTLTGIKFDWLFRPSHFVAGDMFNFFELDEQYVAFYQLDVSGHGVGPALLSFTLYHHITNQPRQAGLLMQPQGEGYQPIPPQDVLYKLNNYFQNYADSSLYFTIIYGYLHKPTGELQLAQAGHPNPIYLSHASRLARKCGEGGFPVGMLPNIDYDNVTLHLQPGDRLFIYSDGITECMNQDNSCFSEDRLIALLENTQDQPLAKVLQQIGNTLQEWHAQELFDDDITLLAMERV